MTPKIDSEGPWTRLPEVADLSDAAVAQRAAEIAARQAHRDAREQDEAD